MGCGASSESSQRGDSAGSSGTEAVAVTVAELKAIRDKYFAKGATAETKDAAIEEYASKIKDIPADDANHAVKTAFGSESDFFMQHSELLTEVLGKYKAGSVHYKAAMALLEHNGFNAADVAGCVDALPGVFPKTFQDGDYDTKQEICGQIFQGVDKTKGAPVEDILQQQSANFREIFYSVDRLDTKMKAYVAAVAANDKVDAAYEDMVKELNGIPFDDVKLTTRIDNNETFAENYLRMIVAVVKQGETTMEEYVDVKSAWEADLLSDLAECKANLPAGFVDVLKKASGFQTTTADLVCVEMFKGPDFAGKMDELGDILKQIPLPAQ